MNDLKASLKQTLATVYAFFVKAQNFHWNVEGHTFYQLHKLFEKIYEDAYDSIDRFAEHIRTLDSYAPGSFTRFKELSVIEDELKIPDSNTMVEKLTQDNDLLIQQMYATYEIAEKYNKQGLINYLGERIEQHDKWGWFLRALLK